MHLRLQVPRSERPVENRQLLMCFLFSSVVFQEGEIPLPLWKLWSYVQGYCGVDEKVSVLITFSTFVRLSDWLNCKKIRNKTAKEKGAKLHSAVSVCQEISEKPPSLVLNFWHHLLPSAVFITPCLHTLAHLTAVSSVYSCSPLVSLFFLTSASALSSKTSTPHRGSPRLVSPASFSSSTLSFHLH